MLKQALFLLVLIFYLMLSVLADSAANSNIYVQCSDHCFTSMTPYESNVNSLFTSIIDSSSTCSFDKFKISPPECSQNDVVYGLFQCRGDLSSANCKDCVTNAISQLKTYCPSSTGGGIQLDGCFVKYDHESFFGAEDKMEVVKTCGPSIGYNADVLNRIDCALQYLIAGNGQYFRAGDYGSIAGVAQCVQDLSDVDCQDCLTEACGRLRSECETSAWGNMYLGKCYITYVDQGNDSHGHNSSSSSNKSSGGGNMTIRIKKCFVFIGVAMAITAVAVTLYFLRLRKTDKIIAAEKAKKEKEKAAAEKKKIEEEVEKKLKEKCCPKPPPTQGCPKPPPPPQCCPKPPPPPQCCPKPPPPQCCPKPSLQCCPKPPPIYCPNPPPPCYVVQEGCTYL